VGSVCLDRRVRVIQSIPFETQSKNSHVLQHKLNEKQVHPCVIDGPNLSSNIRVNVTEISGSHGGK
jgi:hypothetical protein